MPNPEKTRFQSITEALEERVLFDGVPDATFLLSTADAQTDVPAQVQFESAEFSAPRELILIDASVEDGDQLLAGILESKSESAPDLAWEIKSESMEGLVLAWDRVRHLRIQVIQPTH